MAEDKAEPRQEDGCRRSGADERALEAVAHRFRARLLRHVGDFLQHVGRPPEPSDAWPVPEPLVQEALSVLPEIRRAEVAGHDDGPAAEEPSAGAAPERILLADDDDERREFIAGLLAPYYQVDIVTCSEAALQRIGTDPPALVLSDAGMSCRNGLSLLRHLRAGSRTRALPVILLCARAGESAAVAAAEKEEADDLLAPPITRSLLLACVGRQLELARFRRAAEVEMHRAHSELERLFEERTSELARTNRALRESEERFRGTNAELAEMVSALQAANKDASAARRATLNILEEAEEARRSLQQENAERKRVEDALRVALEETERARAEAEAAGQAKDHFLAVLSHELRTPLTPVLMTVHTLAKCDDLPPEIRKGLEMIRRNIELEARFIDDLLDLTRIGRGKMEIVRAPMDVHEAVLQAVQISEPDIQGKRQTLTVALEAAEHRLCGDSIRLQQVFWNLLKNASKFTPEGGAIRVRSRNENNRIWIEVADTGVGFEPEAAERIFDAFAQANEAITREFGGLGLGLAISKATVEAHGGAIRGRSEGRHRGAVFTVELPLGGLPA